MSLRAGLCACVVPGTHALSLSILTPWLWVVMVGHEYQREVILVSDAMFEIFFVSFTIWTRIDAGATLGLLFAGVVLIPALLLVRRLHFVSTILASTRGAVFLAANNVTTPDLSHLPRARLLMQRMTSRLTGESLLSADSADSPWDAAEQSRHAMAHFEPSRALSDDAFLGGGGGDAPIPIMDVEEDDAEDEEAGDQARRQSRAPSAAPSAPRPSTLVAPAVLARRLSAHSILRGNTPGPQNQSQTQLRAGENNPDSGKGAVDFPREAWCSRMQNDPYLKFKLTSGCLATVAGLFLFVWMTARVSIQRQRCEDLVGVAVASRGRGVYFPDGLFAATSCRVMLSQQELDLSKLGLRSMPGSISLFTHLETLDVSENEITALSVSLLEAKSLRHVDLRYNLLTTLPLPFWELLSLNKTQYDLFGNPLASALDLSAVTLGESMTSLPSGVLRSVGAWVQHMNLSGHSFTNVSSFRSARLPALRSVDLSRNQFAVFPRFDGVYSTLESLYLEDNQLTTVDIDPFVLPRLSLLDVSDNALTHVPRSVNDLPGLRMRLWGNPLENLYWIERGTNVFSDSIQELSRLRVLLLDDNTISTLPGYLRGMTSLRRLSLTQNNIASESVLSVLPSSLEYLSLDGNNALSTQGAVLNGTLLPQLSVLNTEPSALLPSMLSLPLKQLILDGLRRPDVGNTSTPFTLNQFIDRGTQVVVRALNRELLQALAKNASSAAGAAENRASPAACGDDFGDVLICNAKCHGAVLPDAGQGAVVSGDPANRSIVVVGPGSSGHINITCSNVGDNNLFAVGCSSFCPVLSHPSMRVDGPWCPMQAYPTSHPVCCA